MMVILNGAGTDGMSHESTLFPPGARHSSASSVCSCVNTSHRPSAWRVNSVPSSNVASEWEPVGGYNRPG